MNEPVPGGPHVVVVGGGHGAAATLRAARRYAGRITAVVTVADDGGSSGRLRAAEEQPAPGDLRKCLVALAAEPSLLTASLEVRFDHGELAGHAAGNLLLVALERAAGGDLVAAVDEAARVLGCVGRILPATTVPVTLVGRGRQGEVRGQVRVGHTAGLESVWVDPPDPPVPDAVLDALATADQVVIGPGSLYTSVLAAAAVPGVAKAVMASPGQRVYVCNLRPEDGETVGYGVAEHVGALRRHGLEPDVVLVDAGSPLAAAGEPAAHVAALATPNGLAHDPELLGRALSHLLPA